MLNADKYIDRLREIVKPYGNKSRDYTINRIKDIIKDYDEDFNKAMEEMEKKNV